MKNLFKLSVLSNILFLGATIPSGSWYVIIAGLMLMLGSGWMHYVEYLPDKPNYSASITADWFGMINVGIAIAIWLISPEYGYWLYPLLTITQIILFESNYENTNLVGAVFLICIITKIIQEPIMGFVSLGCFICFLFINNLEKAHKHQDHTVKHIIGALGILELTL